MSGDGGYAAQALRAAAALREIRELQGLTQAEAAARMGTTQSAVSKLETSGDPPEPGTLARYAEALGAQVRVAVVVSWEGSRR